MAQKNNRIVVPEAKEAMEQFKMQAANDVGAPMELERIRKPNIRDCLLQRNPKDL